MKMKQIRGASPFLDVGPGVRLMVEYGHYAVYTQRVRGIVVHEGSGGGGGTVTDETLFNAYRLTVRNGGEEPGVFRVETTRYADRSRTRVLERKSFDTPVLRPGEEGSVELVLPLDGPQDTAWVDSVAHQGTGEVHAAGLWLSDQAPDAVARRDAEKARATGRFLKRFVLIPLVVVIAGLGIRSCVQQQSRDSAWAEIRPAKEAADQEFRTTMQAAWAAAGGKESEWYQGTDVGRAFRFGMRPAQADRYGSAAYAAAAGSARRAAADPTFANRYRAALYCDAAWVWVTSIGEGRTQATRAKVYKHEPQLAYAVVNAVVGNSTRQTPEERDRRFAESFNSMSAGEREAVQPCFDLFKRI